MEDYPHTLDEFRDRFSSEEACLDYLMQFKWPDGFICHNCGGKEYRKTKRGLFQCRKCGRQISIISGTIFHGTRKSLKMWFEAMWHITSQKYGANALGLQRVLGLGSYHTAWEWLHRLRRVMVRPGREKLLGMVEVDETLVGGKRTGKRGRGAEGKAVVMVMVEDKATPKTNKIGRIRLRRIPDASGENLIEGIKDDIQAGSIIRTDNWNGYNSLPDNGYYHQIVSDSNELTICHLVASLLKRWLLGAYQGAVRFQHLDYYLDEFTFRFNRRTSASRGKLFYRLVQHAMESGYVTKAKIVGGKGAEVKNFPPRINDD
jgi:transposase-like protein